MEHVVEIKLPEKMQLEFEGGEWITEDETKTLFQICFAHLYEEFSSVEGSIFDLNMYIQHAKVELVENVADKCDQQPLDEGYETLRKKEDHEQR
jgi:hypothetical protein